MSNPPPFLWRDLVLFTKNGYDDDQITAAIRDMKYVRAIKKIIRDDIANPSEECKAYFSQAILGNRRAQSIASISHLIRQSVSEVINELVNRRRSADMNNDDMTACASPAPVTRSSDSEYATEERNEGFAIIRDVLSEALDEPLMPRVKKKDLKTVCKARYRSKDFVWLFLNEDGKRLSIGRWKRNSEMHTLASVNDIRLHADELKSQLETVRIEYGEIEPNPPDDGMLQ